MFASLNDGLVGDEYSYVQHRYKVRDELFAAFVQLVRENVVEFLKKAWEEVFDQVGSEAWF